MKKILAILSDETKYAERLSDYCNKKKSLMFTAVPFESIEACAEFNVKHDIEVLLADSKYLENDTFGRQLSDIRAARVIGLDSVISFERAFADAEQSSYLHVGKYQPADMLIREVMAGCDGMDVFTANTNIGRPVRVIGVYSPVSRCGKTSFALTLSRMLSKKRKTLYISLEEFSCLGVLSGERYEMTLSDAIYHMRQGTLTAERLYSMIHTLCGVEYLPPMRCAEDRNAVSGEDYVRLINEIIRNSLYEAIVIDMERFSDEASEIAEICNVIYMPVLDDVMNKMRTESFIQYLINSDRTNIADKTVKIRTPKPDSTVQGTAYLDALLYGSMGDLVRELGEV